MLIIGLSSESGVPVLLCEELKVNSTSKTSARSLKSMFWMKGYRVKFVALVFLECWIKTKLPPASIRRTKQRKLSRSSSRFSLALKGRWLEVCKIHSIFCTTEKALHIISDLTLNRQGDNHDYWTKAMWNLHHLKVCVTLTWSGGIYKDRRWVWWRSRAWRSNTLWQLSSSSLSSCCIIRASLCPINPVNHSYG